MHGILRCWSSENQIAMKLSIAALNGPSFVKGVILDMRSKSSHYVRLEFPFWPNWITTRGRRWLGNFCAEHRARYYSAELDSSRPMFMLPQKFLCDQRFLEPYGRYRPLTPSPLNFRQALTPNLCRNFPLPEADNGSLVSYQLRLTTYDVVLPNFQVSRACRFYSVAFRMQKLMSA
jgi:hypothetical protein